MQLVSSLVTQERKKGASNMHEHGTLYYSMDDKNRTNFSSLLLLLQGIQGDLLS
jgi:hypothetical protein